MELILNAIGAIVCATMAKKRGRGSVRWFFLGLFFHVFAIAALLFLGRRGNRRNTPQSTATPAVEWRSPPLNQATPLASRRSQQGHVDLNALRAILRGNRQEIPNHDPVSESIHRADTLDPERRALLQLIVELAPTIDFSEESTDRARQLRDEWLSLGQVLVHSGESGGVTDDMLFYQLGPEEIGPPVLFYPAAPDDSCSMFVVQFACLVKRFRHASAELIAWVDARTRGGFAGATLFHDHEANVTLLSATGVAEMASASVNEQNLGALCDQVRSEAQGLRRDIPARFGGIWAFQ